ncbi:hypothetical protein J4468_03890 [Candidatus Woesearchaeota archaeon]|nr:hypothetical protein [Candidatus Woesearchaeota archaeon]
MPDEKLGLYDQWKDNKGVASEKMTELENQYDFLRADSYIKLLTKLKEGVDGKAIIKKADFGKLLDDMIDDIYSKLGTTGDDDSNYLFKEIVYELSQVDAIKEKIASGAKLEDVIKAVTQGVGAIEQFTQSKLFVKYQLTSIKDEKDQEKALAEGKKYYKEWAKELKIEDEDIEKVLRDAFDVKKLAQKYFALWLKKEKKE